MSRKKRRRQKRIRIEGTCHFCPFEGYVEEHHLIPQKFMGGWVPYGTIDVCKSCHNIIDDLTRNYIYRPVEDRGSYVYNGWESRVEFWKELKKRLRYRPQTMTPFDQKWLLIYNYFMKEVVPLWEAHRKKTINQILGLEEGGEPIQVFSPEPLVRDIKHWWELPTLVLENYMDSGLGDPRKAKWRVVIEGKKTYYQVEPKQA